MSFTIKCPQCSVSLKASRAPAPEKLMQCPKCTHWFTPQEAGIQSAKPLPVIPMESVPQPQSQSKSRSAFGLWIGSGIAAILFMSIGATGAYLFFRPANDALVTSAEPRVTAKVEPPIVEKKVEVKAPAPAPTEGDKNREAFKGLMSNANVANQLKSYEEAVAGYAEALKLFPDDAEARKKFAETKTALEAVVKARKDQQLAETEAAALIKKGDDSLGRNEFAAAADFYKQALAKTPASQEAVNKMVAAQGRVVAEDGEKKKLEDFDKHILAGKAALKEKKTVDAIKEISAAARILPDDPLPPELLKEAEKQIAQAKNENNKKDDLQALLNQAAALKNMKKWDEAKAAYEQVLRLSPSDATALKGLQDINAGMQATQSDIDRQLKSAYDNLRAGRIDQAMEQYREIARQYPSNLAAQQALQAAQLVLQNRIIYYQLLDQALQAMRSLRYAEAVQLYNRLLQLVPGDPYIIGMLTDAQRLLDLQIRASREYDALINQANALKNSRRFAEAARTYAAALQLSKQPPLAPNPALPGMIRYNEAMSLADAALKSGRWADAVNAYTAALREIPNDPMASAGLTTAQNALRQSQVKKK